MTRKLILIFGLILIALAMGARLWLQPAQSLGLDFSGESNLVSETVLRARKIYLEAEYTFNTSQFEKVYINDPRGGDVPDEALALIREIRQDPTIQKDQVGILDYHKAAIENMQRKYEKKMEELRAKEAAGTLTEEERLALEWETYGWPTPESEVENAAPIETQTCELLIEHATATRTAATYLKPTTVVNAPQMAYPEPRATQPEPESAYPEPRATEHENQGVLCPTPTSKPFINVPYRSIDPALRPPEVFEIDIYSIEIDDDIARAVVNKGPVTTEYVLVKVDGQWYIAGAKLLKFEF